MRLPPVAVPKSSPAAVCSMDNIRRCTESPSPISCPWPDARSNALFCVPNVSYIAVGFLRFSLFRVVGGSFSQYQRHVFPNTLAIRSICHGFLNYFAIVPNYHPIKMFPNHGISVHLLLLFLLEIPPLSYVLHNLNYCPPIKIFFFKNL